MAKWHKTRNVKISVKNNEVIKQKLQGIEWILFTLNICPNNNNYTSNIDNINNNNINNNHAKIKYKLKIISFIFSNCVYFIVVTQLHILCIFVYLISQTIIFMFNPISSVHILRRIWITATADMMEEHYSKTIWIWEIYFWEIKKMHVKQ